MRVIALVLRALRWRAVLSVTVWACAVVVCGAATLGPIFALAAAESGLQDVLRDAGPASSIRLEGRMGGDAPSSFHQVTAAQARERFAAVERLDPVAFRPKRIGSLTVDVSASAGSGTLMTKLVSRDGVCALVEIDRGRCPTAAGEAMVSARATSFRDYGWRVGAVLSFGGSSSVRVVGVYTPISTTSPAWSGQPYFLSGTGGSLGFTDAVFTPRSTFERLPKDLLIDQAVDLPIDAKSVRLGDVAALARQPAELRKEVAGRGLAVTTDLPSVLRRIEDVQARIDSATALVVLQLCVLGWLVLHRVLLDTIEARGADIALAKLRGFGSGALLRFGLGEPAALLLLAMPAAFVVAVLGAQVLARATLLPGTPVAVPWQAFVALLLAVAGGMAAVLQTARSALRRPVLEQWRRTRVTQRSSRVALGFDLAVALLAVGAFVLLRSAGPALGAAGLLGPGLLVVAAGFSSARVLPLVLRPLVPATSGSRRIPVFLAVRQVVRRPAGLRLIALLTVASGIAVFGVGGAAVAADNRQARAAAEIGADRVEALQVRPGEDVLGEVAAADPQGRWAAAAATWLPDGGDVTGTVLAVDSRRLRAVESPAAGVISPARLAALTLAGTVRPLVIRGTSVVLRATVSGARGGPLPTPVLQLQTSAGHQVEAPTTGLRTGASEYRAPVPCRAGCRLVGIELRRDVEAAGAVAGTLLLQGLAVDGRAIAAGFDSVGSWHAATPNGTATDRLRTGASGLEDRFSSEDGGDGGIAYGDVAAPVPAVATSTAARIPVTARPLEIDAGDGTSTSFEVQAVEPVLPVVLDDGLVVDVRSLDSALPFFAGDAHWSVWLGPHAPPDATARLSRAGLVLDGTSTLADRRDELARQGPALALLLLAVCAAVGALLAMGGTAVSIGAAVRRRSYEAASLGTVGISRSQIYRAALLEQLLLLGSAVVVGVPAGIVALLLAMPIVPQSTEASPVPLAPLPSAAPILLCAAVLVVLVSLTTLVSAARVVRAASASRLREAEE